MSKSRILEGLRFAALVSSAMMVYAKAAQAAEKLYAGVGIGFIRDGGNCEVVNASTNQVIPTSQCDTNSIEGKLYGGYRFSDFAGVEIGYMGLRSTSVTLTNGGTAKFDASGIPVQAVAFLPAGTDLTWIGKLGIVRWSGKVNSSFAGNQSDSGFSFGVGAGAEYYIGNGLLIRGEIEYFPKIGDEDTVGEADITAIGVSVKFSF